jgi:dephospho-CoA kinase
MPPPRATTRAGVATRSSAGSTLRLSVVGLTGSGKSTTTDLLGRALASRGLTVSVVKLADPLYRLQRAVYEAAGVAIQPGDQDQVLLEALARELRRISPTSLVDDFMRRLERTACDVALNDDLRDTFVDYPALRDAGFRVLRVRAPEDVRLARLGRRSDLTVVANSTTTVHIDEIEPDAVIVNDGTLDELAEAVERALVDLL